MSRDLLVRAGALAVVSGCLWAHVTEPRECLRVQDASSQAGPSSQPPRSDAQESPGASAPAPSSQAATVAAGAPAPSAIPAAAEPQPAEAAPTPPPRTLSTLAPPLSPPPRVAVVVLAQAAAALFNLGAGRDEGAGKRRCVLLDPHAAWLIMSAATRGIYYYCCFYLGRAVENCYLMGVFCHACAVSHAAHSGARHLLGKGTRLFGVGSIERSQRLSSIISRAHRSAMPFRVFGVAMIRILACRIPCYCMTAVRVYEGPFFSSLFLSSLSFSLWHCLANQKVARLCLGALWALSCEDTGRRRRSPSASSVSSSLSSSAPEHGEFVKADACSRASTSGKAGARPAQGKGYLPPSSSGGGWLGAAVGSTLGSCLTMTSERRGSGQSRRHGRNRSHSSSDSGSSGRSGSEGIHGGQSRSSHSCCHGRGGIRSAADASVSFPANAAFIPPPPPPPPLEFPSCDDGNGGSGSSGDGSQNLTGGSGVSGGSGGETTRSAVGVGALGAKGGVVVAAGRRQPRQPLANHASGPAAGPGSGPVSGRLGRCIALVAVNAHLAAAAAVAFHRARLSNTANHELLRTFQQAPQQTQTGQGRKNIAAGGGDSDGSSTTKEGKSGNVSVGSKDGGSVGRAAAAAAAAAASAGAAAVDDVGMGLLGNLLEGLGGGGSGSGSSRPFSSSGGWKNFYARPRNSHDDGSGGDDDRDTDDNDGNIDYHEVEGSCDARGDREANRRRRWIRRRERRAAQRSAFHAVAATMRAQGLHHEALPPFTETAATAAADAATATAASAAHARAVLREPSAPSSTRAVANAKHFSPRGGGSESESESESGSDGGGGVGNAVGAWLSGLLNR